MSIYEIIDVILGALSLGSIGFLAISVFLSIKNSKDAHDEQRRILTVKVIKEWCDSLTQETRLSEIIVESLPSKECKNLYDNQDIHVDKVTKKKICKLCPKCQDFFGKECKLCKLDKSTGLYTVSLPIPELRTNVNRYLNNLEIVAIAWHQSIVDKEILEEQFAYLDNPGTKTALEAYRAAANNGKSYPALAAFYTKIKNNNGNGGIPKNPL